LFLLLPVLMMACNNTTDKNEKALQRQVDALYQRLSLEEKAAQLFGIYPGELMVDGEVSREKCREVIPYGVGHICQPTSSQPKDADQIRRLVRDIQAYLVEETPAGIPAIFHEEALTGLTAKGATIYPQAIGAACSWNPELIKAKTSRTAADMRAMGQQYALSPMIDLIRTPLWPRIEESCGEDGFLTAVMACAFVGGLQEKGFREGVAGTTKHFLGYGGANTLSWKELYEEVLLPHEAVIRTQGSESVMTSYDRFREEYAVCSDTLINVILRGYLGYTGAIVSDYGAVQTGRDRSEEALKQYAVNALTAGNDLELAWNTSYKYIPELVREGRISEEVLEKSVKRALMLKARAGLLDPNPVFCADGPLELDSPEGRQIAYELATQSIVLLKNEGILPLQGSEKIALVGPNANSVWSMLGDYTFPSMQIFFHRQEPDLSAVRVPTLLEALKEGFPGEIGYERGCDWSTLADARVNLGGDARVSGMRMRRIESADPTSQEAALRLASRSDIIIAAMGENVYLCGENRARNGIRLPGDQEEFVRALIETGKPVVLVVFGGHPQVLSPIADGCAAIVQAWYPGEEGGRAVTDILTGRVNPSGHLCVSYPATEDPGLRCYNELPEEKFIAWPFGYGLSYTSFSYSDLQVQPSAKTSDKRIHVSCRVTNTGGRAGDEVVQLYVSPASGQPLKPLQLKGFQRVSLAEGESATVHFELATDQLAWWFEVNGKSVWTVSPGDYCFRIGPNSAELPLDGLCQVSGKPVDKALRDTYF
ncbi:MAG: glycoside hydrolase family 3 C-terminal domain-containing protein, partial [Bacteroidales bacterium]|nr:glycoside hydrolase family 3 C-terminal domain-containing protein [Bacteroidales bacterium]